MNYGLLFCLLFVPIIANAAAPDPFAGVTASSAAAPDAARGFFAENFGFRRELMSEFSSGERTASRQSAGFETQKKFSSDTWTWGSVDLQGRLVRRDRYASAPNDMEGMNRPGWFFEYHNAYADFYDPAGHFNGRVGRFYVPFGLNTQTDTHGTVLQLSNEQNFGFERDWYAGLWGNLTRDLDYSADYLAGSGYDLKYRGQSGLASGRVSLSNRYLSDDGLEGGLSALTGERLSAGVVRTERVGADGRWRHPVAEGTVIWTTELSGGRDASDAVFMLLHQLEYLRASRRWGLAAQFRRFRREGAGADSSVLAEATWYFRNDVANSNLHWIKLNVERPTERMSGRRDWITTLQYYRYW